MSTQTVTAELMPKEGKSALSAVLDLHAKQINEATLRYQELEGEAARLALEMGIRLLIVKDTLPHGRFTVWCDELTQTRDRQRRYYMAFARAFLEDSGVTIEDACLLVEQKAPARKKKKMEELVFSFLGDKSQAELFAEHGIKLPSAKALRAPSKEPAEPLPPGETAAHLTSLEVWNNLCSELNRQLTIHKSHVHLTAKELKDLETHLYDAYREVHTLKEQG